MAGSLDILSNGMGIFAQSPQDQAGRRRRVWSCFRVGSGLASLLSRVVLNVIVIEHVAHKVTGLVIVIVIVIVIVTTQKGQLSGHKVLAPDGVTFQWGVCHVASQSQSPGGSQQSPHGSSAENGT